MFQYIYDYFGTNKLILSLYETNETKKFLEQFNRVELIENNKEFDIGEIIKKINKDRILEEFSPKNIAKIFLKDIKEKR